MDMKQDNEECQETQYLNSQLTSTINFFMQCNYCILLPCWIQNTKLNFTNTWDFHSDPGPIYKF